MKKKVTQYLAVIFSLLVVGEQFCSARVSNEILKRQYSKRATFGETINGNTDQEANYKDSRELAPRKKRFVVSVAQGLFAAAFIIQLGAVGLDLGFKFGGGCCIRHESICDDQKKFKNIFGNLRLLSDDIDARYLKANQLFEWSQSSNYEVNELWLKIERIANLNNEIVTGINPAVIAELEAISAAIEEEIKAKNDTVLAYEEQDFTSRFQTVWDKTNSALQSGFYLASYPLSLLAQRLVNYFVQRSISKFATALSVKYKPILKGSLVRNGKAASFFGVKSVADIDANVKQTAKAISRAKYSKTVTWSGRVLEGVTIVTSLATIGLEVWNTIEKFKACDKIAKEMRNAVSQIKVAYEQNVDLNETVTSYDGNITYYWNDVRRQLVSNDLDQVLVEIKNLTLYAADASRMQLASSAIEQWFAGIDNANEAGTYNLLQVLNAGLSNVSYTLECYRNKYRAINYISQHCRTGDDTLEGLYRTAQADFFLNDNDCIDGSGYTYTTYKQMEGIIEGLAKDEGYNFDCILNSETQQELVCYKHWNGETTAQIAETYSLTRDQVLYFTELCGEKPLDPTTLNQICTFKKDNVTGYFTVAKIAELLGLTEARVEEALERCDQESTTEAPTTTEATTTTTTTTKASKQLPPQPLKVTTKAPTKAPTVTSRRRRRRRRRRAWKVRTKIGQKGTKSG